jgi:hypothetical protein
MLTLTHCTRTCVCCRVFVRRQPAVGCCVDVWCRLRTGSHSFVARTQPTTAKTTRSSHNPQVINQSIDCARERMQQSRMPSHLIVGRLQRARTHLLTMVLTCVHTHAHASPFQIDLQFTPAFLPPFRAPLTTHPLTSPAHPHAHTHFSSDVDTANTRVIPYETNQRHHPPSPLSPCTSRRRPRAQRA